MDRVAINGRFSAKRRPTGTQTVAHEIVEHVTALEDRPAVVLMVDPQHPSVERWATRDRVEIVPVPFTAMGRDRAQLHEQTTMHRTARQAGCKLVHHPMNTCPRWPGAVRSLVTLHDLNFHHNPQWYGRGFRTWLEWTMIPGLKRADTVVCISEYVRDDAVRTLGLAPGRTHVIPNGLKELAPDSALVDVVEHEPPAILAVNPWQPHKNLVGLLRAVHGLVDIGFDLQVRLAGRPHENFRDQPELAMELAAPHVHVLGYLSDEDLAREYRAARVLAMPSFEEGFGLPVLEALHHGSTVVTSNVASLPEVAGDAAFLVDPHDVDALREALRAALTEDQPSRRARVARGRAHAARFDWNEVARSYVDVYRDILSRS